jgi:hypothetical protein
LRRWRSCARDPELRRGARWALVVVATALVIGNVGGVEVLVLAWLILGLVVALATALVILQRERRESA